MPAETRYAQVGDRQVAYQVVGDGPVDLLVVPPAHFPVDLMWEVPSLVAFRDRLSSFSRSIWFDAWGSGASAPLPHAAGGLAESVVDVLGVLDAVGSQQVAMVDLAGGPYSLLFGASHPERTRALVLDSPTARFRSAPDYPEGLSEAELNRRLSGILTTWGTGRRLRFLAPSMAEDERFVRWLARCERLSHTPDEACSRFRAWFDFDIRAVLPVIRVPTLVVVRPDHRLTAQSRYVAAHVEGARAVELSSAELLFFAGDTRPMLDAIEEFLTGRLPAHDTDRALATVVFTDLVQSTEHLARVGDRRWRELLATHDTLVRSELHRFCGREVQSTGDGFLARFDGPARAVRCASAIREAVRGLGLEMRIGVHTGEVELQGENIGGIAVHIAQRVMTEAQAGEIITSSTVRDLVAGSGLIFEDRGLHRLKGLADDWRLYAAQV
jgi:class 3 adenylate cyclase